ncbi:bifunctional UDP-sugar hydrolase/5'-nucleotidase UshA (plasmid) [Pseudoalteromonas sp. T1lg65]|uniref:bifunctional UDP-sugar hydrolase/5'-nucleotidase UshA n=1 Tax=Pseudoalteromonas sp. T1lg65 TaxID=2077101 RepID=UPI003F79F683
MRFSIFALSSLLLSLSACQQTGDIATKDASYLTILHTNDNHGRFWRNSKGEYGMAARKTLLDSLRNEAEKQGHAVVLLSGGDINTGVPESDLQFAEPDFRGMKKLGYDAMAIGNHEFDNPREVLDKQITWAEFPLLSANIIDQNSNQPAYQPYTILDKKGLKIAILGLTTVDTAKIANPKYIDGLTFENPVTTTLRWGPELEKRYNPDFTIAVTHMGHYHNAKHGINAPGDVTLARSIPQGTLDMIVGGHSQEPICVLASGSEDTNFKPGKACHPDKQNGTWIMQAHEWGKYVGKAVFEIAGDKKSLISYELIPVNLKDEQGKLVSQAIAEDEEMLSFLAPYQQKGLAQIAGEIGYVDGFLDGERSTVRFKQSNLAKLIINAQMQAVDADFGVISGGGIRGSIEAGSISYKDILTVHPFKNRITYIDWTAQELLEYLNIVARFPEDSGAYMQYHHISFTVTDSGIENIKIAGKPLDMNKTYRMSINSYNASGGDTYPSLTSKANFTATDQTDAQVLKAYIEANTPIKVSSL